MTSPDERKARDLAESVRERSWHGDSFLRDLFMGRFRLDLIHPFRTRKSERPEFRQFFHDLEAFLLKEVDPVAIDATGEYPEPVIRGLAELGAFGLKIGTEYGGLGLTHSEYVETMQLLGSYDANITALLSAHQAIGVPQPIKLFGTEDQKQRFLPRCARGAISAFALTEPAVGSDPGALSTEAELGPDGNHYILNGEKLWCTNGTLAELIVVMARNPANGRINAFVVETDWDGVLVEHRCHFMGLRALANASMRFENVRIPVGNRIGEDGEGLKIALVTLNTGRLTLPAGTAGAVKRALEISRKWATARIQWGVPIGHHEAVAERIADMTTRAFAMETMAELVGELADRKNYDLRLEAAAAKEWNTREAWSAIDDALQVRGGRGYETERSLEARGEPALGIERMMRDARINLIFEGSSEIMHLFMAREAVDKHLDVAGVLVDPDSTMKQKLSALPRIAAFYAWWYPGRWIPRGALFRFREFGNLAGHMRFVERRSRKLSRALFHGMLVHRAKLERKQSFLFHMIDIAMELLVMTATLSRAVQLAQRTPEQGDSIREVADLFCRRARRRVDRLFHDLWFNDAEQTYALARSTLEGRYVWLEDGIVPLGIDIEDMKPEPVRPPGPDGSSPDEPSGTAAPSPDKAEDRRAS